MALTRFHAGDQCLLRPGDVIIHWHDPDPKQPREFPLHVAIYVGPRAQCANPKGLMIRGLPATRSAPQSPDLESYLGDVCTGEKGAWYANMAGRRLDVDEIRVEDVVLLSQEIVLEHSQLGTRCEWNEGMRVDTARLVRGALPLFVHGTCAHFVEYLYEGVGLDLVSQARLRDPSAPQRLYPALQLHAFWRGVYPLDGAWDDRFRRYPECLFGEPATDR